MIGEEIEVQSSLMASSPAHCTTLPPPASLPDPCAPLKPWSQLPPAAQSQVDRLTAGRGSFCPSWGLPASEHSGVPQGTATKWRSHRHEEWPPGAHTASSQPTESEGLSSRPPPQWLRSPAGHALLMAGLISEPQEHLAFGPRTQGRRLSGHLRRRGVKRRPEW